MKKDEVLKMDLSQYKDVSKCPDYSFGIRTNKKGKNCSFRFFCLGDNCQSINNTTPLVDFTYKGEVTKKFITNYCYPNQISNNDCITSKCTTDSDCISNKCDNGVCIVNDHSPFTECTDVYLSGKVKMVCGKIEHEQCSKDEECTGTCYYDAKYTDKQHNDKLKRCHAISNNEKRNIFNLLFLIFNIVGDVLIVTILAICWYRGRKEYTDRTTKVYPVNSFKKKPYITKDYLVNTTKNYPEKITKDHPLNMV